MANPTGIKGRDTVSASDVEDHLHQLRSSGWSYAAIARVTGMNHSTVCRIGNGSREHVEAWVGEALMALEPHGSHPDRLVPKRGAVRRLEALQAIGHDVKSVAERTSHSWVVRSLCSKDHGFVSRAVFDEVAEVYRQLSGRRGNSARALGRAKRYGFASPAQWNDIDNDDTPEKP